MFDSLIAGMGCENPHEVHAYIDRLTNYQPEQARQYLFKSTPEGIIVRAPTPLTDWARPVRSEYPMGASLMIQVDLNPIRRNGSKEFNIHDPAELRAWVEAKLAAAGLTVMEDMAEDDEPSTVLWIKSRHVVATAEGKRVPFRVCSVRALVTVTDPAAFKNSLQKGIGRKLRYGVGMIQVVSR